MKIDDLLKPEQSINQCLEEGNTIYLWNDIEEVGVRLSKDGTYLKFSGKKEYKVNYKESRIAGDAVAYGGVITKEEYEEL